MIKCAPRMISWLTLLLLAATLLGRPAHAAKVERVLTVGATTVSLVGEIVEGDAAALRTAIDVATAAGDTITEIRLNSIGGNLREGISIVRIVFAEHLNTRIASDAVCASVCFLAFAAGRTKTRGKSARVGVHVASIETGTGDLPSATGTAAMAHIARILGVPDKIIDDMIATPATAMFWLDKADLDSMGAITSGDG